MKKILLLIVVMAMMQSCTFLENYGHTYAGDSFLCTPVKPAENWEIEVYGTKNIQNCYWVEDRGHGRVLHSTKKTYPVPNPSNPPYDAKLHWWDDYE